MSSRFFGVRFCTLKIICVKGILVNLFESKYWNINHSSLNDLALFQRIYGRLEVVSDRHFMTATLESYLPRLYTETGYDIRTGFMLGTRACTPGLKFTQPPQRLVALAAVSLLIPSLSCNEGIQTQEALTWKRTTLSIFPSGVSVFEDRDATERWLNLPACPREGY